MENPPGTFIRAGGGYSQPWTRDASVNSWNAASLLEPQVAENTLWSVVVKPPNTNLYALPVTATAGGYSERSRA